MHFSQLHSECPGHPEYTPVHFLTPGTETTIGPVRQSVATNVGMAIAPHWFGQRAPIVLDRKSSPMFGRDRYVGLDGQIIVLADFGASAPLKDLLKTFDFTVEPIVAEAQAWAGRTQYGESTA